MKLLTYEDKGQEKLAVLHKNGEIIVPVEKAGLNFAGMNELIMYISQEQMTLLKRLEDCTEDRGGMIPLEHVKLLAPIPRPRQDIICLGMNYAAHMEEAEKFHRGAFEREKAYPVYFSKRVNRAAGHMEGIPSHRDILKQLDYEAELAVVLGRDACGVKASEAFQYIFGYTIINDISAREIQTRHKQWYFGKSMDGFCPMGPYIVTRDEFREPPVLKIKSRVNGEPRQDSSTGLLLFSIAHVIEELSAGMTLEAGTVISMGTPAGVAMGMENPVFLSPGDVVECEVEGIGILKNPVI